MSDAPETPKKKKKGKLGRLLILGFGAVLLLGGGIGAGLFFSGALGSSKAHAEEVDPNKPQLVPRGGEHGEGGEGDEYESSYQPLEKEFTSNLKDSTHFVQMGIAVGTNYDARVLENVTKHELAIRSAVLMTISETEEDQVFTTEGKEQLQRRLVQTINHVLEEKTGFGGVGNVYFTNFIVQ
ncbi:flagellar FliL protein [Sphingomonas jejuensis]|uniref:Flagellar protein FliL n=1 Tax=Sphingomonas jejuensis TaxID=904715 RepID=A0ABX0XPE6_9SPHN|nr:flagellar basal body-associated FliL family protein [Sphingomonas jejuensis]NJC34732.1 flagellar FliL protein [Sphingomonas jejuensis]